MANSSKYLSYDERVDHLTIFKSDEDIMKNIDTGLVILSLNKKKEIIGLEFMGANKNFNIPQDVLRNIKDCKVEIKYLPDNKKIIVKLILKYKQQEQPLVYSYGEVDLGKEMFSERFACVA